MASLSLSGTSSSVNPSVLAPSAAFVDLPKVPLSVASSAAVQAPVTPLEIDTSRRLLRGTNIVVQGVEIPVAFKYERLFNFCYYCGTVDHVLENCVETVKTGFNVANCLFGDWLRGFPPRPRPWVANRWAPMPGSASNPFMPRAAGIPPGFRALAPAAPPPALPMPVVREALPPPPGPLLPLP